MGFQMRIFYVGQALFFMAYSIWAGHNYIIATKEAKCAKAETAAIILQMPVETLTEIKI